MVLSLIGALLSAVPAPVAPSLATDSSAVWITVAPQESLRVTTMGPRGGPVVVIIPGLVSPAFGFRKILAPLAEAGVRTIVIEPLGVGWSSHPEAGDYSHTAQGRRIGAVLDSLHLSGVVLMGHSVGCAMALRLATTRPELISRMLLIEGGAVESASVPGVKQALQFAWIIKLFAGRGRVRKELRKGFISTSGDTTWVTESVIDGYTAGPAGDMGAVLRALKGMDRAVEPDSLRPKLSTLKPPVRLLIGGAAHEGGPSEGRIRTLARRVPHFSMRIVFGAGHYIHEEQPDVVVQELLALIRSPRP